MARIQKISLNDFEAGVLMGFIGEWKPQQETMTTY